MRFGIFLVMNFQLLRDHIYMKIFYEHCYQPWFEAGVYKIFTGSILISFPTVIFLKKMFGHCDEMTCQNFPMFVHGETEY